MVLSAKMKIQQVPSKGRISIAKLQNFTLRKRQSVVRVIYGALMVVTTIVMMAVDPVDVFSEWYLDMREGSFVFKMWQKPTYQLYSEVYIYNYTNVDKFLSGEETVLKLNEVGPFLFQEIRTNENMTIDRVNGVLNMRPNISLKFLPERSVAHTKDVNIMVPNIALIAISTLAADQLGFLANTGAYYSISAIGAKLFLNLTAHEYMWGYHDPLVTVANSLLPGWIDFGKLGIMDRFYDDKMNDVNVELELRDKAHKYTLRKWGDSEGIPEQGFTSLNTSKKCNRIYGSYEGLMLSSKMPKNETLSIFRKQACRIYPFEFNKEFTGPYGFTQYGYQMSQSAFNKSSPYACDCLDHCLPDGFVDISGCYYGFPITLSKPHFLDTDPAQMANFEGMHPDPVKHNSFLHVEPLYGVPISLSSMIQVNIAVRMSSANPLTKPLKDKILPLIWLSMYCKEPPPEVITLLRLRFVIAPPLIITLEIVLLIVGMLLGGHGFYRIWKPKYMLIPAKDDLKPKPIIRKNSKNMVTINLEVADNKGFDDDDDLAKEAVSLLAIREEEGDIPDLLTTET